MQQTLLALLGLLIVTMLSFSQQRAGLRSQQQAIRVEYSQMALGVARQVMGIVETQKFKGGSPQNDCLDGWDIPAKCGKIWSFHTDETLAMESPDYASDNILEARTPDRSFPFQVEVEVHHATLDSDGNVQRTSSKSDFKEITVRVQDCQDGDPSDENPCDGDTFLTRPITITEVVGDTE